MTVRSIALENYRNLSSVSLDFSEGINVLWGRNAQGKSNLLESVYFFARGKSFRGAKDRELIRFGEPFATLELTCRGERDTKDTVLTACLPADGRRRLRMGGAPISSAEMIGAFRAVLFCPSHLSLVSGAPALRRAFLDIAISQLSPAYISALTRYNRFLTERNALCRSAEGGRNVSRAEWETYAEGLSLYGSEIAAYRAAYAARAARHLAETFCDMTDGSELPEIRYVSHAADQTEIQDLPPFGSAQNGMGRERLREMLLRDIDRDVRAGATLHGIHKDDLVLLLNGRESRLYASQGQMRSLALGLKLAEGAISREITGENPVFLLDDVLSELDSKRQRYILRLLTGRQIIVTSCEPELFRETEGLRMWQVEEGHAHLLA